MSSMITGFLPTLWFLNILLGAPAVFAAVPPPRRPPPPPPPPSSPVYQASPSAPDPTPPEVEAREDSAPEPQSEEDEEQRELLLDAYTKQTRKQQRRDWYIYYAYVACAHESDMNKCARYAEAAVALDPDDGTANQLYKIATRRGGKGSGRGTKPGGDRTKFGPLLSRNRIGVGAVILLAPEAHHGYLINPEYVLEFKNRSSVFLQLGFGGLVGKVQYVDVTTPEAEPDGFGGDADVPVAILSGGVRVRFQVGAQFKLGWHSMLRVHGGISLGFLGAKVRGDERTLFLQIGPEAGIAYHLGRVSIGVAAAGSALIGGSDEMVAPQGFGIGVLPRIGIGF